MKLHPFLYPWTLLEAKRLKQSIYFSFWPIVEFPLRSDFFIHWALHPFNTEDLSPLTETLLCLVSVTSHWRSCYRMVCGFSVSPLGSFLISERWELPWAWFSTVVHRNLHTMLLALFDVWLGSGRKFLLPEGLKFELGMDSGDELATGRRIGSNVRRGTKVQKEKLCPEERGNSGVGWKWRGEVSCSYIEKNIDFELKNLNFTLKTVSNHESFFNRKEMWYIG